jgi:probable rRNA maturation factor
MSVSVATNRPIPRLAVPLKAVVRLALFCEEKRAGDLGVLLVDDERIRALNHRYRKHDRVTDVLSFPYHDPKPVVSLDHRRSGRAPSADGAAPARAPSHPRPRRRRPLVHGDIVISLDRVRAQARRYRVSEGQELARLVIHGALHLAGHDHHRPSERALMRRREELVVSKIRRIVTRLDRALRAKSSRV